MRPVRKDDAQGLRVVDRKGHGGTRTFTFAWLRRPVLESGVPITTLHKGVLPRGSAATP
jgi:hypothetical protein